MKGTLAEKKKYAKDVVDKIKSLNPPGRFLKRDITCARRSWYELGEKDILTKTGQAFRQSIQRGKDAQKKGPQIVILQSAPINQPHHSSILTDYPLAHPSIR